MSWTLCTSGAAINEAGVLANSTIIASNALLAQYSDHAEGLIVSETRWDFVTYYANVNTLVKGALSNCCAKLIANDIVRADPSGYTGRAEAGMIVDMNTSVTDAILKFLKDADSNKIRSL